MKDGALFLQAIIKFFCGLLLTGLLLFLPAGTLAYRQGWLLLAILFLPMFFAGLIMLKKSPDLLRKRLNMKERQGEQKQVVFFSGILFLAVFIIAGLSYRFQWMLLPYKVSLVAAVIFLLAYLLYAEVIRENAYLSRTVEVQKGQTIVDTGLYGIVRHPMYFSTLLLFPSMPLVLGSVISFAIMLFYIPLIVLRIRNEEEVLSDGLPGYRAYMQKVRYRLIPFVW